MLHKLKYFYTYVIAFISIVSVSLLITNNQIASSSEKSEMIPVVANAPTDYVDTRERSLNYRTPGQLVYPSTIPIPSTAPLQKSTLMPKPSHSVSPSPKKNLAQIVPTSLQHTLSVTDKVVELVNKERLVKKLPRLSKSDHLTASAQGFSTDLANNDLVSHTGSDGSTMQSRNEDAGYVGWRWLGENVAGGQSTPDEVFKAWMNSEGHRQNILSPEAQEIGVGYSYKANTKTKHFWVQEFGAKWGE